MKNLARSFVCWLGIDQDVQETVKQCDLCRRSQHAPAVAPLQPWGWPQHPWAHLHVNYAGPHLGYMFLVIVDAHSKWMEINVFVNASCALSNVH